MWTLVFESSLDENQCIGSRYVKEKGALPLDD